MKLTTPVQIIFFSFFTLILIGTQRIASPFWQLIFLAAVVVFIFRPAYSWLSGKTRLKPALVTAIIYLPLLLVVALPLFIGLQVIGSQAVQLGQPMYRSNRYSKK